MPLRASGRPAALALALFAADLNAQEVPRAPNRVYLEALGTGLVYSLNYERDLTGHLSLRAGAGGLWSSGLTYLLGFGGPSWRLGAGRHWAFLGLYGGAVWLKDVWILEGNEEVAGYAAVSLGYRFQPGPRGAFLQVAFTPVLTTQEVAPWGGVGFGVAF
jgi:hypothetical protein